MNTSSISKIQAEHRSLAAVLDALSFLVKEVTEKGVAPRFGLLRLILDYIEGFPDHYHHPKEDLYLFPLVRRRSADAEGLISELEVQHTRGPELLRALRWELVCHEQGAHPSFAPFAELARNYIQFYWTHMRLEEDELLALARRVLGPEDWAEVDRAFAAYEDQLGGDAHLDDPHYLFEKILRLSPPPVGIGSSSD